MKCILCDNEFEGYGNDPWPIAKGKCCDSCNYNKVIPRRLRVMNEERKTIVRDR